LSDLGEYRNTVKGRFYVDRRKDVVCDSEHGHSAVAKLESHWCNRQCNYISAFQHKASMVNWKHVSPAEVLECFDRRKDAFAKYNIDTTNADSNHYRIYYLDILYCCQDAQRLIDYERDEWHMTGVIAKADITTPNGITHVISSGGIWGIDSDSDDSSVNQIIGEEIYSLSEELSYLGFQESIIKEAIAKYHKEKGDE